LFSVKKRGLAAFLTSNKRGLVYCIVMKIYLIEDDPIYAEFIAKALQSDPANELKVFQTGEDCLKSINHSLPDVMIIDYKLPGISGIDLYEKIKPRITDKNKVILLSSLDDGNMVLSFIQRGVRDYVIKDENVIDSLMSILSGSEDDYYLFN
jgi:DNA-binding NarL/FixJ family response regulator